MNERMNKRTEDVQALCNIPSPTPVRLACGLSACHHGRASAALGQHAQTRGLHARLHHLPAALGPGHPRGATGPGRHHGARGHHLCQLSQRLHLSQRQH